MLKLIIVFLVILKSKSENENRFRNKFVTAQRIFDFQQTDKPYSSIKNKEMLYLFNPMTQNVFQTSSGKIREYIPNKVLEDNKNNILNSIKKYSSKLEDSFAIKTTSKPRREEIPQRNGLMHVNVEEHERVYTYSPPKFSNLKDRRKKRWTNRFSTYNPMKRVVINSNVQPGSFLKGKIASSKFDIKNIPGTDKVVTGELPNVLENMYDEGSNGEQGHRNYGTFGISKYKSDTREDCLPQYNQLDNTATRKSENPVIFLDSEQDDGPISLIFSLLDLNTLKPRPRYTFTDNKLVKKGTTKDMCKCLTKASSKKSSTNDHGCSSERKSSTATCQSQQRKSKSARSTGKISSTTWELCKHITPLFTVEPWPDLTVARDLCQPSKLNSKSKLARTFYSSLGTSTQKNAHSSPNITDKSNQKNGHIETNFPTTSGSKLPVQGSHKISSMPNTQDDLKSTTKLVLPLPLITPQVGVGVNPSSTQETKKEFYKMNPSLTSSALLTTLIQLNSGSTDITYSSYKGPAAYSTQEPNVINPKTSFNQINFSETSSSTLIESINPNQTESKNTIQSTQSVAVSQEAKKNNEINEPTTHTGEFQRTISSNGYSGLALSSNQLQESTHSNQPIVEKTICVNSNISSRSPAYKGDNPVKNDVTDKSSYDQNKILNGIDNTKGLELQATESIMSLFPLCLTKPGFYAGVESLTKLRKTESSEDSQNLNFSPPPSVVFSHEPEFIVTLFNEGESGRGPGMCAADLLSKSLSSTINKEQSEQLPVRLEDLFVTPQVTKPAVGNEPAVQGKIQVQFLNNELNPETLSSTEPNEYRYVGEMKSMTSSPNVDTLSKGPFNIYFSDSKEHAHQCLADFSRIFSNLATKKCE